MSTRPPRPRSSTRGRAGPFGALLAAVARDPAVARGLAHAYAELDPAGRLQIVEAVVADAEAEGISSSLALAPLLAVEEDAEVARAIFDAMSAEGGQGLQAAVRPRALLAGDDVTGGALLVRPLHATFVEVISLAWSGGEITHSFFEPFVEDDGVAARESARLPDGLRFEEAPISFAIDLLAPILWSYRRAYGRLPLGAERFADLFSISPDFEG